MSPTENNLLAYDLVLQVIASFNGDAEKLYVQFNIAFKGGENLYEFL